MTYNISATLDGPDGEVVTVELWSHRVTALLETIRVSGLELYHENDVVTWIPPQRLWLVEARPKLKK